MSSDGAIKLRRRRERLSALAAILKVELFEIEKELKELGRRAGPTFTQDFFWREVAPLLAGERYGLTGSEIRRRLAEKGIRAGDGRFRTFLTRQKEGGNLEMDERSKGYSRWRLSSDAEKKLANQIGGQTE
jgi:hypothetical protein